MTILLPRLSAPAAEAIAQRFIDPGPESWPSLISRVLPETVRFAATGGTRINDQQLIYLRGELERLAEANGQGDQSERDNFAQFDAEAAVWFAQEAIFSSGEALRDDVWSFIGTVLAPDIVRWRFGTALERYVGGVRNTFQRLWMRGRALDRGVGHADRWRLVNELTEDAFVQIIERPSLGGDPVLALAIGEAWLRASVRHGRRAMEPLMRKAILRIRIRNEIQNLAELSTDELGSFLDDAFIIPAPIAGFRA